VGNWTDPVRGNKTQGHLVQADGGGGGGTLGRKTTGGEKQNGGGIYDVPASFRRATGPTTIGWANLRQKDIGVGGGYRTA